MLRDVWLMRLIFNGILICAFCLLAPLIHILFMYFAFGDSVNAFHSILNMELESLTSLSNLRAARTLYTSVDSAYNLIMQYTVVDDTTFSRFIIDQWEFVQLLTISTQLITLRLSVIVLSLPLILACFVCGFSIGALIWYIRRTSGTRDSAFIYHRAKAAVYYGTIMFLAAYIFPPVVFDPRWMTAAFALFLIITVTITVGCFKKYF